jgi:hypothetical protein
MRKEQESWWILRSAGDIIKGWLADVADRLRGTKSRISWTSEKPPRPSSLPSIMSRDSKLGKDIAGLERVDLEKMAATSLRMSSDGCDAELLEAFGFVDALLIRLVSDKDSTEVSAKFESGAGLDAAGSSCSTGMKM